MPSPKPQQSPVTRAALRRLIGFLIVAAALFAISPSVGRVGVALATVVAGVGLVQLMLAQWWVLRLRLYGMELEARCLKDLSRICSVLGIPFKPNIPVPGCGDADALVGKRGTLLEIKSWRRWDPRCQATIDQVQKLRGRIGPRRAVIWLPNGKPAGMQRFGLGMNLPDDCRVAFGGLWSVLFKVR